MPISSVVSSMVESTMSRPCAMLVRRAWPRSSVTVPAPTSCASPRRTSSRRSLAWRKHVRRRRQREEARRSADDMKAVSHQSPRTLTAAPAKGASPSQAVQLAARPDLGRVSGASRLLQTRCACGGTCPGCVGSTSRFGRTVVGSPNDPLERQAESIANAASSGLDLPPVERPAPRVSRVTTGLPGLVPGPGRPLGSSERASMEARFAWHFGDVRIHTDQAAAESARMLGARAYSVGDHLVFSGGGYAPSTAAGLRLLAHELAHV